MSNATFSVDGGPPTQFSTSPRSIPPILHLFNVSAMQNTQHSVGVVHHGVNNSTPLTLQLLIIQRTLHVSPSISSIPSATQPVFRTELKHPTEASIGGIVTGGLVFLLIIASGYFTCLRRRKKARESSQQNHSGGANTRLEPYPASTRENATITGPRKARTSQQYVDNPLMHERQLFPITKLNRPAEHGSAPVLQELQAQESTSESGRLPSRTDLSQLHHTASRTTILQSVDHLPQNMQNNIHISSLPTSSIPQEDGIHEDENPPPLYTTH